MKSRVVVVSHACVIDANQAVYADLERSFDVTLVVPSRWRDELRTDSYRPRRLPRFHGEMVMVPTWPIGRPQRHVALLRHANLLRSKNASFVVIEEEPFSLAGRVWSSAAYRTGILYAVQVAENLPRNLPPVIEQSCRWVLSHASFVLARSPAALAQAREWGYRGPDSVVVHAVDEIAHIRSQRPNNVVGYVGRLVPAKGIDDLVRAVMAQPQLKLRVAGDGPLRDSFSVLGDRVEMLGTLSAADMNDFYDSVSVVVAPSRTTKNWSEQFGRAIVEAQARSTPVVAYSSGEIPWVASLTAAQLVAEGDIDELGNVVARIAADPVLANEIGSRGREGVEANLTNRASAERLSLLISASLAGRSALL